MAHERVLKQERLYDGEPHKYNPKYIIRRVLRYITTNRGLEFLFDRDGNDDTANLPIDKLNLDVYDDTEFYLRLSSQKDWRWSRTFDAITTKKENSKYYGKVQYEQPNGTFAEWDGKAPRTWDSSRIIFLASLNEDSNSEKFHGFSMNIELILPNGGILPITLDPDIQNPRLNPAPLDNPQPGPLQAL